jgi:uncharacterized protein (TIGR03437 family)
MGPRRLGIQPMLWVCIMGLLFADHAHQPGFATQAYTPTTATAGDFDEDGTPDLVVAVRRADGTGLLELRRGQVTAVHPQPQASQAAAPFLAPANHWAVPLPPELLGAGDFDADGHADLVIAQRGGSALVWLRGTGHGTFREAETLPLDVQVTALATGDVNRADGLPDLLLGVTAATGDKLLVYEGAEGALRHAPEVIPVPATIAALAVGQLDQEGFGDIAVAAGEQLLIVHGRDRRLSLAAEMQATVTKPWLDRQSFPATIRTLALGTFTSEQQVSVAVLLADGTLQVLLPGARTVETATSPNTQTVGSFKLDSTVTLEQTHLVCARLAAAPLDQLLVFDQQHAQVSVVGVTEAARGRLAFQHAVNQTGATLTLPSAPLAIIPWRLNADALSDLVILSASGEPVSIKLSAPAATFTVTNTNASGAGSFQQALLDANASSGADSIHFNLPGSAPFTINLQNNLPRLTEAVTLDGTTQPGYAGQPLIEINGGQTPNRGGLWFTGGNSVVRGLVMSNFENAALSFVTNGNNRIEGNYLGTDLTGTSRAGSGGGVGIASPGNIIGGTVAAARNVIAGNSGYGISFANELANNNLVQGNWIGVNTAGTAVLSNQGGIGGATNNTGNLIGGTAPGARNVIAGGFNASISLGQITVQGNFIGTNATGTAALPNNGDGVYLTGGTVGGTTPAARNVIAGQASSGVFVAGPSSALTLIQGNFIGVAADGTTPLPNGTRPGEESGGVEIHSGPCVIGGTVAGAGNLIAGNLQRGIYVYGGSAAIRGNSIFNNTGLGIDLVPFRVTPNDDCDADTGPNNLQNYPVITSAMSAGNQTVVRGTLNSLANTSFTLEFFANAACNPAGYGEGQTFLGSAQVTTGAGCQGNFEVTLPVGVSTGQVLTVTATDPQGNTSEFSRCAQVNTSADLAVTLTPSAVPANAGTAFNYTMRVKNLGPNPATDILAEPLFPAEVTLLSCAASAGAECGSIPFNQRFAAANLAVGAEVTFTVFGRVNCSLAASTTLTGSVSVSAATGDPTPANNAATVSVTAQPATVSLSPLSQTFGAAGGFAELRVSSVSTCPWTVTNNAAFIQATPGETNFGNGQLRYYVAPNLTNTARQGTLIISGQTFTVTQAAGTVTPQPTPTPLTSFGSCAMPQFRATARYPVGGLPASVAAGDFNNDGFPDMAVAGPGTTQTPGTVGLLLNNRHGGFEAVMNFTAGAAPVAVAIGDFNRDTNLDLAVANRDSGNVSVLLGNGQGGLGAARNVATGATPQALEAADFNHDGRPDLAVVNGGENNLSILLGDGLGGFAPPVNYPAGTAPLYLTVNDFNADGQLDLAVAATKQTTVFLGDGQGSFSLSLVGTQTGNMNAGFTSGDVNADGRVDLLYGSPSSTNGLVVLYGDGAGQFALSVYYEINNVTLTGQGYRTGLTSLTTADVNADGRADVVTGNQDGTTTVLLSLGNGEFRSRFSTYAGGRVTALVAEDFDGDGQVDVGAGHRVLGVPVAPVPVGAVSLLFNGGDGRIGTPNVGYLGRRLATGDFNGDGRLDLLGGDTQSKSFGIGLGDGRGRFSLSEYKPLGLNGGAETMGVADFNGDGWQDFISAAGPNGGAATIIYWGDGTGRFTPGLTLATGAYAVAAGDLNGDGKIDVAIADRDASAIVIALNNGMGGFSEPVRYPNLTYPGAMVLADFNGDGASDIAVLTVPTQDMRTVSILFNDGTGKLAPPVSYPMGVEPTSLTTGDFNADGKPDLAVGHLGGEGVAVLLNDGTGKFPVKTSWLANTRVTSVTSGDFTGDGKADLAATNESQNSLLILPGDGAGGFSTATEFLTGTAPNFLLAGDFNSDGKLDLASSTTGSRPGAPGTFGTFVLLNGCTATGNLAATSAASFRPSRLASDSIAAGFGANLAAQTQTSSSVPLPTTLAGISLTLKDSFGEERLAPLFFVSPGQLNFQVPPNTAPGPATLTVVRNGALLASGSAQVSPVAPGLFTANANGQGVAAALVLRVASNGTQSYEAVAVFDAAQNRFVAQPITVNVPGEQVFLILFGTGIRGHTALARVQVELGGRVIPVIFADQQGSLVGVDQLNVFLPNTLAGFGETDLQLIVDGVRANPVRLRIK